MFQLTENAWRKRRLQNESRKWREHLQGESHWRQALRGCQCRHSEAAGWPRKTVVWTGLVRQTGENSFFVENWPLVDEPFILWVCHRDSRVPTYRYTYRGFSNNKLILWVTLQRRLSFKVHTHLCRVSQDHCKAKTAGPPLHYQPSGNGQYPSGYPPGFTQTISSPTSYSSQGFASPTYPYHVSPSTSVYDYDYNSFTAATPPGVAHPSTKSTSTPTYFQLPTVNYQMPVHPSSYNTRPGDVRFVLPSDPLASAYPPLSPGRQQQQSSSQDVATNTVPSSPYPVPAHSDLEQTGYPPLSPRSQQNYALPPFSSSLPCDSMALAQHSPLSIGEGTRASSNSNVTATSDCVSNTSTSGRRRGSSLSQSIYSAKAAKGNHHLFLTNNYQRGQVHKTTTGAAAGTISVESVHFMQAFFSALVDSNHCILSNSTRALACLIQSEYCLS